MNTIVVNSLQQSKLPKLYHLPLLSFTTYPQKLFSKEMEKEISLTWVTDSENHNTSAEEFLEVLQEPVQVYFYSNYITTPL